MCCRRWAAFDIVRLENDWCLWAVNIVTTNVTQQAPLSIGPESNVASRAPDVSRITTLTPRPGLCNRDPSCFLTRELGYTTGDGLDPTKDIPFHSHQPTDLSALFS